MDDIQRFDEFEWLTNKVVNENVLLMRMYLYTVDIQHFQLD